MGFESLFVLLACFCQMQLASSWGYSGSEGPVNWHLTYPACNGNRQSPIHLTNANSAYKSFDAFKFTGYDVASSSNFQLENNGHTLQLTLKSWAGMSVVAFGKTFRPWQIHFHWGATDAVGSEHSMKERDSELHPGEMHFVHVNTAYPNVSVALTKYDGLMVFGSIMEIDTSGKNNSFISKLTPHFSSIILGKTKTDISSFPLRESFMVPTGSFFHYNGSLTTPTCNEAVQWVVFTKDILLSHSQMVDFRTLLQRTSKQPANITTPLSNNYRPVQQRNGRAIYRSFKSGSGRIALSSLVPLFGLALLVLLRMD